MSRPETTQNWTAQNFHVLLATWLGTLFDGMDCSIYILTLYPSLSELLGTTSHATVGSYGALLLALFMFGWAAGAVVFGMCADRIGRSKTLVLTVLLYAFCTGLCAICQTWQELALCRFFVGCGIGGEISIGGVLLSECWSGKARLHATGVLQTAFSVGVLILAGINLAIGHMGWRGLYLVGIVPALLAIYIRLKLTDPAHTVAVKHYREQLKQKPKAQLNAKELSLLSPTLVQLLKTESATKLLVLVVLAATVCVGNYAVIAWVPAWVNQLTGTLAVQERSYVTLALDAGGLVGALLGGTTVLTLGRKRAFQTAFLGALISCIGMFLTTKTFGTPLLLWAFTAGFFVISPFTYLFIYVPELFDTHLRATAFGFCIQSGRIFAGLAAIASGLLITTFGGSYACAGACVSLVYLLGLVATMFMPASPGVINTEPVETEDGQPSTPVKICEPAAL